MAGKKGHCCQAWVPAGPCRVQGSQIMLPEAYKQIWCLQQRSMQLQTHSSRKKEGG